MNKEAEKMDKAIELLHNAAWQMRTLQRMADWTGEDAERAKWIQANTVESTLTELDELADL